MNNLASANENAVLTGCEVTQSSPLGATIDVSSGKIFFGVDSIDVSAQADIAIAANVTAYSRLDLVALNTIGVVSIIQGTASVKPIPADYNPDDFIILANLTIGPVFTEILDTVFA